MSDWVSIDRATIDTHRTYEVMWPNGDIDTRSGRTVCRESAVAVRDVTPKPPKRREWHVQPNVSIIGDAMGAYRTPGKGRVRVREVLPGDCDPDVVREVVKEMRERAIGGNEILLKYWADRLECKQ